MKKSVVWQQATQNLKQAGKPDARFEAELLLRSALKEDRARFFSTQSTVLAEEQLFEFWQWIEDRVSGVPLQHLVGQQEFMGLDFKITADVLIPRPDTEIAVEVALEFLRGKERPLVVDIATGSGAIAVALAHHHPGAKVWATDLSAAALAVAKQNAVQNGVDEQLTFIESSWGQVLIERGLQFDCIVANPPYISSGEIPWLAVEVQNEPHLALDGGSDGLDCYRALAPDIKKLLRPGGHVVLEMGNGQAGAVSAILWRHGLAGIATRFDLAGLERVVTARLN